MVGRSVVSHAAGKSSDSLPGCSTFADWWFATNITPTISKVSFIWQPLLSCSAIYEMPSNLRPSVLRDERGRDYPDQLLGLRLCQKERSHGTQCRVRLGSQQQRLCRWRG